MYLLNKAKNNKQKVNIPPKLKRNKMVLFEILMDSFLFSLTIVLTIEKIPIIIVSTKVISSAHLIGINPQGRYCQAKLGLKRAIKKQIR